MNCSRTALFLVFGIILSLGHLAFGQGTKYNPDKFTYERVPGRPGLNQLRLDAGAAIDIGGFRYVRQIAAGKAGLNSLPLDAEVLAHSNLADLRIAGADGHQIPYILDKAEGPLTLDLPALEKIDAPRSNAFAKNREPGARSYYRLRLPFSNLPSSQLVFATSLSVFQRHLSILIETNPFNNRQQPWTESITESEWACTVQDKPAPALTLMIPSLKTAEMMLVVEEGDNRPIPITSVKLLLPSYRLRFFRESQTNLKLYYGNSSLDAPRYDLAILAPYLTGSTTEEIHLGPGIAVTPAKGQPIASKIFWGILIAAVLALLVLVVRLSKKA
jgi:hypothetical protein